MRQSSLPNSTQMVQRRAHVKQVYDSALAELERGLVEPRCCRPADAKPRRRRFGQYRERAFARLRHYRLG